MSDSMVDRHRELAELQAGIDEALSGRGKLFTIAGEPGIGKSRLAEEAANWAATSGARTLWGRCWEGGGAPAYWPWIQILRGLTSVSEVSSLSRWAGTDAAEIAQIVPELRDLLPDMPELPSTALAEPEQARFRLFDSAVSFLRRAAEAQPLVLVLDDLHAADPTSLLMLLALAKDVRRTRVAVIGTYREVEIRQSPERAVLIAEAEREGVVLPLRGLGEAEIGEFIERAAGTPPTSALTALLSNRTEGNPFFLREILHLMAAEGQFASGALTSTRKLRIPSGVQESIRRRIEPLDNDARDVLTIASVIGREFDLGCLEAASQVPRDRLIELLDAAASLELVSEMDSAVERYSFRHTLIRETLYNSLSTVKRRTLHRLVAESIESTCSPALPYSEIAYHLCAAAPISDVKSTVDYSRQAARIAQEQLAYEEAAHHLGKALEVLHLARGGSELLHAELLFELGQAQTKAGDLAEARSTCLQAAGIARNLKRPELFAGAVVAAGRAISNSGTTDRALTALLTEALALLGETDAPVRAQVLARLGIELYWSERDSGVALCQRAVAMARRLNDPHTLIIALWAHHLSLRNPDSLEQRLADTKDIITIAEQTGEKDFALEARFYRIADLLESGDIAGADFEQSEYLKAESELRDRFKRGVLLQGMRALMDGRFREAEDLAQQALVAGQQSRRPLALNSFLIQFGNVLWERGRVAELEAPLRKFISENPLIVFARCGLLLCLLQQGRKSEAAIEFQSMAANEFGSIPRDWNWLPSMFVLADVCAELADVNSAATLFRLLSPYSTHNAMLGYVYSYGSVSFALGRLSAVMQDLDEAEKYFQAALLVNQRIRASTWVAHTQYELATVLLKRGRSEDRARGVELITSAKRTADSFEMGRLQERLKLISFTGIDETLSSVRDSAKEEIRSEQGSEALLGGQLRIAPVAKANGSSIDAVAAAAISETRDLKAYSALDGTVTILFSDIVGSSAMYEKLGDLGAQRVIRTHNEIVRQHVAAHKGFEVKTLGDGFMIAFSSARRAVLCAIAVQRAFAAYCTDHPDRPIRIRMGLHVGETISESADFFGKDVILASRIAALARDGQILVSSTLRDLTASAGDIRYAEEAEVRPKGLSGTYRVYSVVWQ